MAVSIKHGSRYVREEISQLETRLTYQGSYAEILAYKEQFTAGASDIAGEMGILNSVTMTQAEGPIWNLELAYNKTIPEIENPDDEDGAPSEQQLSASVISVPIEAHPNYRTCWNHFLVGKCEYEGENYTNKVPGFYNTATDPYLDPMSEGKNYMWVKNLAEAPVATRYLQWQIVKSGNTICRPTKPGVVSFDKALFVIKEIGHHRKKRQAGWAAKQMLNSIVAKPLLGDFNLTAAGYNWKVDNIQIEFSGEFWIASRTYTLSGDNKGWDRDIYP